MDVILDYPLRSYSFLESELDAAEPTALLYEARTEPARIRDMEALVACYGARPGVEAAGEGRTFHRRSDFVLSETEVYRVTLCGEESDVRRFLEDAKALGYGTPDEAWPASVTAPDAVAVWRKLHGMVRELAPPRHDAYLGVADTPRGRMRAWAARWE
jgi:hypothetical protein